jgi:demethylmenaquinone methyltransferase / 2-methoxy-6-polyprenyl-1,4-benzoquinol methylase
VTRPDPSAVKATFSKVALRYDLANHVLSCGIDFIWRKKLVSLAGKETCGRVLDLATGSGDVAFALRERLPGDPEIVGLDFCPPMLDQAREKRERMGLPKESNEFIEGDCMELALEDESFDLVTIAFGLRNLSDRTKGLREMRRVLKPGGRLIVLEFSQPYLWFRPFYYFYLRGILPWMARLITGDRKAYLYLGSSISTFPDRKELCSELVESGFASPRVHPMTFSVVSLHEARKET